MQLEDENSKLRKVVADLSLKKRCYRTRSAEALKPVRNCKLVDEMCSDWNV
jgi:hypothetical protein